MPTCNFCQENLKSLVNHATRCEIRKRVISSDSYFVYIEEKDLLFITGAGKIALTLRTSHKNDEAWLKAEEKRAKQHKQHVDLKATQELLRFEKENGCKFVLKDPDNPNSADVIEFDWNLENQEVVQGA